MVVRAALGVTAAAMMFAGAAHADTYHFINITGNNIADKTAGESQLRMDVTSYSATQVLFTFYHDGATAMSITDIYFDDGHILGIAFLIDGDENGGDSGVFFTEDANPSNLPGANNAVPDFQASAGFTADSDPPAQPNGVNPGETLGIVFDIINGYTFADIIADLESGALRAGIHVQGFSGGGSESFINVPTPDTPPDLIPLPAPAALGLAGLAPLALRRRR